jgi:HK97 family phage prohead protease
MEVFLPLEKFDSEQRLVYGYASTEARDSQGEIVTRAAIEAALPAYMEYANIREMHQLSAVGVVKSAGLDDKGLLLEAKVVDDAAWAKVREGVYKGLSIGGRVTQRDALNKAIITGVELNEISLVDRPANPEALIAAYKAAGAVDVADRIAKAASLGKAGARNSKADLDRIQAMHDASVELGAQCKGHDAAPGDEADQENDDDDASDGDTLEAVSRAGRGDMLHKIARLSARIESLTKLVDDQAALLQKVAAQPAMPKYLAAHAVEKSADGAPIGDDTPKTPLEAIKKAHRNPVRLSVG